MSDEKIAMKIEFLWFIVELSTVFLGAMAGVLVGRSITQASIFPISALFLSLACFMWVTRQYRADLQSDRQKEALKEALQELIDEEEVIIKQG